MMNLLVIEKCDMKHPLTHEDCGYLRLIPFISEKKWNKPAWGKVL
jgi:hypothetical protein